MDSDWRYRGDRVGITAAVRRSVKPRRSRRRCYRPLHTDTLRSPASVFRAPLPWVAAVIAVAILCSITTTALRWGRPAGLTVPAIAAAAVFLYTWKNLPPSFQSAPERSSGRPWAARRILTANGMWWIPVCLSLFPVAVLLPMFAFTQPPMANGSSGGSLRILYCWRIYRDTAIVPMDTYVTHPSEIDDAVDSGGLSGSFYAQRLTEPILLARRFRNPVGPSWLVNTAAVLCWTLLGINRLLVLYHWRFQRLNRSLKWTLGALLTTPQLIPLTLGFDSLAKSAIPVDVLFTLRRCNSPTSCLSLDGSS